MIAEAVAGPVMALTDPQGAYTLPLVMGTYTVTAQADGYLSQTVVSLEVTQTTVLDFALDRYPPPQAKFESNTPVCLGEPLILTNTSTFATGWSWALGDGANSLDWAPTHTYTSTGAYTVFLTVTNPVASDTSSQLVEVNPLPQAAFRWAADDLTAVFLNDSLHADRYLWSFGDGVTSTLRTPIHKFPMAGEYVVTLDASDACGWDRVMSLVEVRGPQGWLHGWIVDRRSGQPVAGAEVLAAPVGLSLSPGYASTDASGYYTMTLASGMYTVSVQADGYQSRIAAGVMVSDDAGTLQVFDLQPIFYVYLPFLK
jgi:PKD repeat protein